MPQTTPDDIVTLDNMIKRAYNDMKLIPFFAGDYGNVAINLIEARNILQEIQRISFTETSTSA